MLKNRKYFFILFAVAFSCNSKVFDTEKQLSEYIDDVDNNLRYSKTVNGINFSLRYKPTDILVSQEIDMNTSIPNEKIAELRNQYNKYIYFIFSRSKNEREILESVAGDKEKFGQMVNELAFGLENKIHLLSESKDTLKMADFIYPRLYGMSKETTVMIAYPRDEKILSNSYINFIIEDIGLNTGEVKFKIKTNSIIDEPKLNFTN